MRLGSAYEYTLYCYTYLNWTYALGSFLLKDLTSAIISSTIKSTLHIDGCTTKDYV